MGFLNKIFGFRWSLYVVYGENKLAYAMHENSVARILGYVMGRFANGGKPADPWSLYLNFNHKHQKIKLCPEHFSDDGESVTRLLIQQIESIDPGYRVKGAEPVFEECATKKRIKISEYAPGNIDIKTMFDNVGKPRETTFFSVMDEVFRKK